MPIYDTFWKRQKRLRGETPDVYQYNDIPQAFRVQATHILRDVIGIPTQFDPGPIMPTYEYIHNSLARELGKYVLTEEARSGLFDLAVFNFLLQTKDTDVALGVIEFAFQVVDGPVRDAQFQINVRPNVSPNEAIRELNSRFQEHGIGYQFESGHLIRLDSKWTHSEIIKPALEVLSDKRFEGASAEFLSAHEHYRRKRYKECLADCLKCFESTMKVICDRQKWKYEKDKDTSSRLIAICLEKGLIPSYLQNEFTSLRQSLESGIPTVRNRRGGHGQGGEIVEVPPYLAQYLLNLTAASVLFLVNAEKELS